MGKIKQDFRYKVVKNILNENEIKIYTDYFKIKHRFNKNSLIYYNHLFMILIIMLIL